MAYFIIHRVIMLPYSLWMGKTRMEKLSSDLLIVTIQLLQYVFQIRWNLVNNPLIINQTPTVGC